MIVEPVDQVTSPPLFSVDSVLHGRISLPLTQCLSVGREIESDVVLGDPSIAGFHLRLVPNDGTVLLEALDGSVTFGDGTVLLAGHTQPLEQNSAFKAGLIQMEIKWPVPVATTPKKPQPGRKLLWQMGGAAVLIIAAFGSTALAVAGRPAPQAAAPASVALAARAELDASGARQAILAELTKRGLTSIAVETLPEGSNRATGSIASREASEWADVKAWADARFGSTVLLVDHVSVAAKPPALAIQSAWLGDSSYVIDGAGEKLFVGASIAEGWTIEAIEAGRVVLRRQGHRLSVRF